MTCPQILADLTELRINKSSNTGSDHVRSQKDSYRSSVPLFVENRRSDRRKLSKMIDQGVACQPGEHIILPFIENVVVNM
jgi:hypothetical protein